MSVCRLSVQSDRDGQTVTVDMSLPAGTPVGALLPTIVALSEQPSTESPRRWRLDRVSGSSLDESITLAENGVHDGELLVLAPFDAPALGLARWGPFRTVAEAGSPGDPSPLVPGLACVWAAVLASLVLCARPAGHPSLHVLIAAIGTCIAAAVAVTGRSAASAVATLSLAAATGFLAVPSGPNPANVLLAAAAAASTSLVLLRWIDQLTSTLVATACFSALVAVVVAIPVVTAVPVASVGAMLSVAALVVLALSGRMAIPLSGITTDQRAGVDEHAIRAHATLTGLIGGCAGTAVLGTVLVAVGCHRYGAPSMAGAGFVAAVGAVLFLRVRTHVDETRRRALAVAGLASISAGVAITAVAYPTQMGWATAVLIAVGLGAARPRRLNAATVRAVEALEYAALVAVIPLGCWVGGCYAMARGVSVP